MVQHTLVATALTAALLSPAFAQSPTQQTQPAQQPSAQTAGFVQSQTAEDWQTSKLLGASVEGTDGKKIGDINDLLIDNHGAIKAAVIGVGGFLGVGEKNVAVPFDKLKISRKPNSVAIEKIVISLNKDELQNAPKFTFFVPKSPQTTGSGNANQKMGTSSNK